MAYEVEGHWSAQLHDLTLHYPKRSLGEVGGSTVLCVGANEEILVLGIDHHRLGRAGGLADDAGRPSEGLLAGRTLSSDCRHLVERLDVLSHLSTPEWRSR